MTRELDIVEWLRKEAELIALDRLGEAADEIERLRADNKQLENEIADMALGPTMVQNQRAEIERLNRYAERLRANAERDANEIERLRALLGRHQVAAWCEEDSDLAVETRAALEPKP